MTTRALISITLVATLAGCESSPPASSVDAAIDVAAPIDLVRPDDLARTTDLAQHVVVLPPPTSIAVAYRPTSAGAVIDVTVARAPGAPALRIVRRAAELPTGPFDPLASLVYEGHGASASHAVRQLVALETSYYAAFSCDDAGGCEDAGVQAPFAVSVRQALADGGYTIYLRHAEDGVCSDAIALGPAHATSEPGWWTSCASDCAVAMASQLTTAGAAEATALGPSLRGLGLARVHASEMCRAVDTASRLGLPVMIERDPDLTPFAYDEERRCATSRARLAESPPPGGNALYVGHAGFATSCDPLAALGFLSAALYRPDPIASGRARFVRIIGPDEWTTLP